MLKNMLKILYPDYFPDPLAPSEGACMLASFKHNSTETWHVQSMMNAGEIQ